MHVCRIDLLSLLTMLIAGSTMAQVTILPSSDNGFAITGAVGSNDLGTITTICLSGTAAGSMDIGAFYTSYRLDDGSTDAVGVRLNATVIKNRSGQIDLLPSLHLSAAIHDEDLVTGVAGSYFTLTQLGNEKVFLQPFAGTGYNIVLKGEARGAFFFEAGLSLVVANDKVNMLVIEPAISVDKELTTWGVAVSFVRNVSQSKRTGGPSGRRHIRP